MKNVSLYAFEQLRCDYARPYVLIYLLGYDREYKQHDYYYW